MRDRARPGEIRALLGAVASDVRKDDGRRAVPRRVAVGIDARDGVARVAGWLEGGAVEATVLAREAARNRAAAIIYTDIGRDGTEQGPDLAGTRAVAHAAGVPVIASGGVGSLEHVRAVAALAAGGVAGVIVGRALYTGAVGLSEALASGAG